MACLFGLYYFCCSCILPLLPPFPSIALPLAFILAIAITFIFALIALLPFLCLCLIAIVSVAPYLLLLNLCLNSFLPLPGTLLLPTIL